MKSVQEIERYLYRNGITNRIEFLMEMRHSIKLILKQERMKNPYRWAVVQADMSGHVITIHKNGMEAARALGISRQAVNKAIRKRSEVQGRYILRAYYVGAGGEPV